jgi:hypothetical protein
LAIPVDSESTWDHKLKEKWKINERIKTLVEGSNSTFSTHAIVAI